MSDYEPQAGTLVASAVKHLRSLKPGVKISTSALCEAIGQPSAALVPSMQTARNHGMVKAEYQGDNRRTLYWSIGDGKPATAAAIEGEEPDEEDARPKDPPPPPPISSRSVFDAAQAQIRTADVTPDAPRTAEDWMLAAAAGAEVPVPAPIWPAYREPETAEIPPPPDAATEAAQVAGKSELAEGHADQRPPRDGVVRFALWSDGKLQIVIEGAAPVVLAREETKALIDYLDVMHGREVAAA